MAEHLTCDIIFSGSGLAGLSLLYRAMKSGVWKEKQIIVADRSLKKVNDKTWSFWEKSESPFEHLIRHRWTDLFFYTHDGEQIRLDSGSYTYNSIRSLDFYEHVLSYLKQFPNIKFVQTEITRFYSDASGATLVTPDCIYQGDFLFNSVYLVPALHSGEHYFLQHFKGVRIKTRQSIPTKPAAWLMDFRTGQEHGTSFFYTFPMATNEVFLEYTLFSKSLLAEETYTDKIEEYIHKVLRVSEYEILEEEYGVVPMTDHSFKRFEGNIIHLGSAGGDTRGSTGYTFSNVQKTVSKIITSLEQHQHPFFKEENISARHQLYDATLLDVLDQGRYKGHQLFGDLFTHTSAWRIFAFLDADTTVYEDLYIMKSLRVVPFLRSFIAAIFKRVK